MYLSSSMHRGGRADVGCIDRGRLRTTCSYSDSKLFVITLAVAVARMWSGVFSNAVDPGGVPTRMGGPGASDDLRLGHVTQVWLASSEDPEARSTGGYWHHRQLRPRRPPRSDIGRARPSWCRRRCRASAHRRPILRARDGWRVTDLSIHVKRMLTGSVRLTVVLQ